MARLRNTALETPANGPPRVVTSTTLGARKTARGFASVDDFDRAFVLTVVLTVVLSVDRFTLAEFSSRPREIAPSPGP